jgi:hypothetical protein
MQLFAQNGRMAFPWHTDAYMLATGNHKIPYQLWKGSSLSLHCIIPFQLKELSIRQLQASLPAKGILFNSTLGQTGDDMYQETSVSLGAGRQLSNAVFFGVQGGYYHLSMANGNKGHTMFAEIICLYQPVHFLTVGCHLINPTGATFKTTAGSCHLSQGFQIGGSLQPANGVKLLVEIEKNTDESLIWHWGFEYRLVRQLSLLLGISGRPFMPSWGLGGNLGKFSYAVGGNLHPVLGLTSGVSLYYQVK